MARAESRVVLFGDLQVTLFEFAKAGDVFPLHTHTDPRNNHISIMARGSVKVDGHPDHAGKVLSTGDVVDWPLNKEHGFTALEDNARLVNIPKLKP